MLLFKNLEKRILLKKIIVQLGSLGTDNLSIPSHYCLVNAGLKSLLKETHLKHLLKSMKYATLNLK